MSCDWDIRCVPCGVNLGIEDANHALEQMRALCTHAAAIAALRDLAPFDVTISYFRHDISAAWFAEHAGHELRPIDEYGRLDGQCHKRAGCRDCGTLRACVLGHGHAGGCAPKCEAPHPRRPTWVNVAPAGACGVYDEGHDGSPCGRPIGPPIRDRPCRDVDGAPEFWQTVHVCEAGHEYMVTHASPATAAKMEAARKAT